MSSTANVLPVPVQHVAPVQKNATVIVQKNDRGAVTGYAKWVHPNLESRVPVPQFWPVSPYIIDV